jgi:hypothetical protein
MTRPGSAGEQSPDCTLLRMRLGLITIVVDDYDQAIAFFTGVLGFALSRIRHR